MLRRLTEELDSRQVASDQHTHRLASVMSALDELQERRELSDSGRGRLRGLLSAPLEQFCGVLGGSAGSLPPSGSGLIRQSSRLSGAGVHCSSSSLHCSSCSCCCREQEDSTKFSRDARGSLKPPKCSAAMTHFTDYWFTVLPFFAFPYPC